MNSYGDLRDALARFPRTDWQLDVQPDYDEDGPAGTYVAGIIAPSTPEDVERGADDWEELGSLHPDAAQTLAAEAVRAAPSLLRQWDRVDIWLGDEDGATQSYLAEVIASATTAGYLDGGAPECKSYPPCLPGMPCPQHAALGVLAALRRILRPEALLDCGCPPANNDGHRVGPGCPAYVGPRDARMETEGDDQG